MSEEQLSEQDFLDSLPDDPEDAFPIYESWIKERCIKSDHNDQAYTDIDNYYAEILAYCQEHNMDIGYNVDDISQNINTPHLEQSITIFRRKLALRASSKRKSNINPSYILTPALREKIHRYIDIIKKDELNKLDLTDLKRNDLFDKLNNFATSIDKDKTRLESLGSILVSIQKYAPDCVKYIEKISKAMTTAEININLRLNPPPKKIEDKSQSNDNADDEIPF